MKETPRFENKCNRCGHRWFSGRKSKIVFNSVEEIGLPRTCPRCKSTRWNKPRIEHLIDQLVLVSNSLEVYFRHAKMPEYGKSKFAELKTILDELDSQGKMRGAGAEANSSQSGYRVPSSKEGCISPEESRTISSSPMT